MQCYSKQLNQCDSPHTHSRCFYEFYRGITNTAFQNLMMLLFEACMDCFYEIQALINGKVNDQENCVPWQITDFLPYFLLFFLPLFCSFCGSIQQLRNELLIVKYGTIHQRNKFLWTGDIFALDLCRVIFTMFLCKGSLHPLVNGLCLYLLLDTYI